MRPAEQAAPQVADIARVAREAVAHQQLDWAVTGLWAEGKRLHRQALGLAAPPPRRRPLDPDTLFDLGPLTMPLATTLLAMVLAGERRLDLAAPVGRLLPALAGGDWAGVRVDMLLDHSAGLPAEAPWAAALAERERLLHPRERTLGTVAARAGLEPLAAASRRLTPPGAACLPSAPGFQVLGWCLARVAGRPLAVAFRERVAKPLGLAEAALFMTPDVPPRLRARAVAGAHCAWRGKICEGEVADLNAWAEGGAAGHAGLFATVDGAGRLMHAAVEAAAGGAGLLHPGTAARFLRPSGRRHPGWGLGMEIAQATARPPAPGSGAGGAQLAPGAIGQASGGMAVWGQIPRRWVGVALAGAHGRALAPEAGRAFLTRTFAAMARAASGGAPLVDLGQLGGVPHA